MAESQEQVQYSNQRLSELERSLSRARLAPYRLAARGDQRFALQLYLWNSRLCKAFLFPLNVAEVTVRNAIHQALSQHFVNRNWVFNPPFHQTPQSITAGQIALSRLNATRPRGAPPITADDLVAALNFDFWSNLFRYEYDPLWATPGLLNLTFPNLPAGQTRVDVQNRVQKINQFRNRIAHHEPIHRARHRDYLDAILDLIGLVSFETRDWVASCSTVMAVVRSPPTPSTGIHGVPLSATSLRAPPTVSPNDSIATLLSLLETARPPIVICDAAPNAVISLDQTNRFILNRATSQGGLMDLHTDTVQDLLATATPLRTANIDIEASTGDLQALFFPKGVAQADRPQVVIVRQNGAAVGAALHPGVKYR
jgi:hypothetical protein